MEDLENVLMCRVDLICELFLLSITSLIMIIFNINAAFCPAQSLAIVYENINYLANFIRIHRVQKFQLKRVMA